MWKCCGFKKSREKGRDTLKMPYPGRLIVVEGTDGSGKSTQMILLKKWLEAEGYPVAFTEWNSSELVKYWTKKAKQRKQLSPTTFSLIHASDFFDRYEQMILPQLRAGYIVLADRYIYTAFARDVARGCDREWVRNTYATAVRPSLALYFQTPLEIAVNRILSGRPELKYHEAGLDIGLSSDPVESFTLFQGLIKEEYDAMVDTDGLTVIDATRGIHEQQHYGRELVRDILGDFKSRPQIAASESFPGRPRFTPDAPQVTRGSSDPRNSHPLQLQPHGLSGKLIVIEGSDYSGHATQSTLLRDWVEVQGYAVAQAGIKRSKLMSQAIEEAKEEHVIGPRTMGVFYATDFADELENSILKALQAGFIVIADRYVYTLIARQLVRGADLEWLAKLYEFTPAPDLVIHLSVPVEELMRRCFRTYGELLYWESGMDLAISPDLLDSMLKYQEGLAQHYNYLAGEDGFVTLNGDETIEIIQAEIQTLVQAVLVKS